MTATRCPHRMRSASAPATSAPPTRSTTPTPDWGEEIHRLTGGVDVVVDAAGSGVIDQAVNALANGGEIALMGFVEQAEAAPDFIA